jgi:hypothetical protein
MYWEMDRQTSKRHKGILSTIAKPAPRRESAAATMPLVTLAEQKYTLSAYPSESLSGLHLMCLMYAAFNRIAPDQATGMDLNVPWITALKLFNAEESSEGY